METAAATKTPGQPISTLRVGLNRHLRQIVRESTYPVDLSAVVDNSLKIITDPVTVVFTDRAHPQLNFTFPPARFVSLDQAGAWVYGITVTPQLQATSPDDALASARDVERRLSETQWVRDSSWTTTDAAVRAWAASGRDGSLAVARFTAGTADLRITLKGTGAPAPSDRLRGVTEPRYFVSVDITDLSRLDRYEAHVDQRRRASSGSAVHPLPLAAFMADTTPP